MIGFAINDFRTLDHFPFTVHYWKTDFEVISSLKAQISTNEPSILMGKITLEKIIHFFPKTLEYTLIIGA